MAKSVDVLLTNLIVDSINPRLPVEQQGQRDAIRTLAVDQGEKLLNLAEDIVEHGLDPSSLAIVIPEPGSSKRYIVVEGNRRVAALRILENPELASDLWTRPEQERLKRLSGAFRGQRITHVPCIVLADRDAANHWILLRHRGEQQGRGIVAWGGLEAARYEQRRGGGRARAALQVIDLVRERGSLDQATIERLDDVPITTVQRLLNDPDVRVTLGIDLQHGELTTRLPEEEVLKGLTRIVKDAAHGRLKVSRVDTKDDRASYLREFGTRELPNPKARLGSQQALVASTLTTPRTGKRKAVPPSKKRAVLIPRSSAFSIHEAKPNDIYHELRRLKLAEFPYAVGVLFRVFLELSIDRHLLTHRLMKRQELDAKTLRQKVTRTAEHLEQSGTMTKRELQAARRIADPQHFLAGSIDTLHAYVHDATFAASPTDLRAAWDSLERFVEQLWA